MKKFAHLVETVLRTAPDAAPSSLPAAAAHARVSVAAGDDDRIPRVFLGAGDIAVLTLAFLAAHLLAPTVQQLFLSGGLLESALPAVFPVPAAPRPELFPALSEIAWVPLVTVPATLVAMELLGGYERLLGQSAARLVTTAVLSQTIAISFSALIVFALKLSGSSRVVVFTYGLFCAIGLMLYRSALWLYQQRRLTRGVYAKNVLLIGPPGPVRSMAEHLSRRVSQHQFKLAGWLAVDTGHPGAGAIPIPRLGVVEDLGELLVHYPVHEVIAIHASAEPDWLRRVIEYCDYFRIRLRIVPQALLPGELGDMQLAFRSDPLALPEIVLTPPRLDADSQYLKRLIDIVVSATLLVMLAPLFLLIALAIKITTPHLPVFYPWRVIGLNGRPFTGYKFTTMVADADEQKRQLLPLNEMRGPVFKLLRDPRTTPFGRFLRKFSLNELPQLWSVLKGDMSLVGPRPAFRDELERYELWQKRKLCVKPGLTCLWQVRGRNRIDDFNEWVRLDLEYIDRWSLWLDMRILARTIWTVVSGSGS